MKKYTWISLIVLVLFSLDAGAQCKMNNTFFRAGEELTYDLYYKYGLINTKAGISSLKTVAEKFNNTDAYKMTLLAESLGTARKFFKLNDTLTCYTTKDIVPLAYLKNAREGKEHTVERVIYTYGSQGVSLNTRRVKNGEFRFEETVKSSTCMYDMMSIVFYARTLDYTEMKKGDTSKADFISGREKVSMIIEYAGIETVEANDDKKYSCIKLTLSIMDKAFSDKKEAMKVYITNDNNRLPVRLESKLNIGSTRAILKSYKGNMYPVKTL
jgi:hypothetical protein